MMIKKHVSTPSLQYDDYTSDPECPMFGDDHTVNLCHSVSDISAEYQPWGNMDRKKKRRAPQPPDRSASVHGLETRAFTAMVNLSSITKPVRNVHCETSNTSGNFEANRQFECVDGSSTCIPVNVACTDTESQSDVISSSAESPFSLEAAGVSSSPGQSPRDKSRLKALQQALASPRSKHKNSKKYIKQENDGATNFRVRKNATVEPPDFSVWTFVYFPENFEIGCEFEIDRIVKYDDYLNSLLNKTDSSHPDFQVLYSVSKRVNQKAEGILTRQKSAPSAVLFKTFGNRIQNTMGKKDYEACNFFRHGLDVNRIYIMEGPVQFANDTQTQHYMFLFSDLLLIAKQKSNTTFKLRHQIRVCDLWIANCIDEVTETTKLHDRSIVIGWPTKNIVAIFKEPETKDLWLSKLNKQIQEEKSKEMGKTIQLKIVHRKNDIVNTCFVPVSNTNDVRDVLKLCMQQFHIPESEQKDYQLWVLTGSKDGTFYPLIGHEIPYAIKQNHVFPETNGDDQMGSVLQTSNNTSSRCEFVLKHKKSTNKYGQDYAIVVSNKRHRRPAIFTQIFHRRSREDKSVLVAQTTDSNQTPNGKLFGHCPENVCTEGDNPAKPILDMLRISFHKGAYTQGFLRRSANARQVKNLREKLDSGEIVDLDTYSPLTVGSTFKEYLRSLPKSLLLDDLMTEWTMIGGMQDSMEKLEKTKMLVERLPRANLMLLKYVMCMLHHIVQHCDENGMDSYNLAVCIAPSLLFNVANAVQPSADLKSVFTPTSVIEYLIKNAAGVFGEDVFYLLGDPLQTSKYHLDSGTDTDSMSNELRHDDSSIDSLVDHDLYTGEVDNSPKLANSHLSNLSHDSGLMLSDGQLNDDDCEIESTEKTLIRSASDYNDYIHHFQTSSLNPIPPPRNKRKKGFDSVLPNSFESYHQPIFTASRLDNQYKFSHALHPDNKHMSSDSLQNVQENDKNDHKAGSFFHHRRSLDMGLLVKSASGSHLYLNDEEIFRKKLHLVEGQNHPSRYQLVRQTSVTDCIPPLSLESKYSYSRSHDSVISDSSTFSKDYPVYSLPDTQDEFQCDKYLERWDVKTQEHSNSNPVVIQTNASSSGLAECTNVCEEQLKNVVENNKGKHFPVDISGLGFEKEISMTKQLSPPHDVNRKGVSLFKDHKNSSQNLEYSDVNYSLKSQSVSLQRSDAHNYDRESKGNLMLTSGIHLDKLENSVLSSSHQEHVKPLSYNQALQRKFTIENGINFDISEQVSQRQKEASFRARQLYESSLHQYLSREGLIETYSSVKQTRNVEQQNRYIPDNNVKQNMCETSHISRQNLPVNQSVESNTNNHDEYVVLAKDPKKLYADSIKLFEQQNEESTCVSSASGSQMEAHLQQNVHNSGMSSPISGQLHQEQRTLFPADTPCCICTTQSIPDVNLYPAKTDLASHWNKINLFHSQISQSVCKEPKQNPPTTSIVDIRSKHLSPKHNYCYQVEEDREAVNRTILGLSSVDHTYQISASNGQALSLQSSGASLSQMPSVTTAMSNSEQNSKKYERKGSELPWSVSKLKNMFDEEYRSNTMTSPSLCSSSESFTGNAASVQLVTTSQPAPEQHVSHPSFCRFSTSSTSSSETSSMGCSSSLKSKSFKQFGPQSLEYDSFSSSSEDLDSGCCNLVKQRDIDYSDQDRAYTDISYV